MSDRQALHKWMQRWPMWLLVALGVVFLPLHVAVGAAGGFKDGAAELARLWNIDKGEK